MPSVIPRIDTNDNSTKTGAQPSPIIKIPGGKRDQVEAIAACLPKRINAYVEPFFGGGAVFFHLTKTKRLERADRIVLSDLDQGLIDFYNAVRRNPALFFGEVLHRHEEYVRAPKETYYTWRTKWNEGRRDPHLVALLRFAAFNGLWRENRRGLMNAPWGKHARLALPGFERLKATANALMSAEILSMPYHEVLQARSGLARYGTVLYVDPPYLNTFDKYSAAGFSLGDHERLVETCARWAQTGASVVYSNADSPTIREFIKQYWPSAIIATVPRRVRINRDGAARDAVQDLLVYTKNDDSSACSLQEGM